MLKAVALLVGALLVTGLNSLSDVEFLKEKRGQVENEIKQWKHYQDNDAIKGYIMLKMTDIMASRTNSTLEALSQNDQHRLNFKTVLDGVCKPSVTCADHVLASRYRTMDGSCNNIQKPHWGMANRPQKRKLPPRYVDTFGSSIIHGVDGETLPNPRIISNVILRPDVEDTKDPYATVMVMAFGQFLDHDMLRTPTFKRADNTGMQCCGSDRIEESGPAEACHPISIETSDEHFGQFNITCMNFVRSAPAICEGCTPCGRQPLNAATSYIDASQVYGTSTSTAKALRSFYKGQMKMADEMLPNGSPITSCDVTHRGQYCLTAGDPRVNVVPNLSILHLTFVREHNRLAERLSSMNPHWDDERLYQESRRIVIAVMQHVAYKEYLPLVLGPAIMRKYRLDVDNGAHAVNAYNERRHPALDVAFSSAAFRFGHSSVTNYQNCLDVEYKTVFGHNIELTYNDPNLTFTSVAGVTRWMTFDNAHPTDGTFERGVRNLLFLQKISSSSNISSHASLDLPAINIHRGRDHGLPSYNAWRKYCQLPEISSEDFANAGSPMGDFPTNVADKFRQVYRHPDDIDLFPGGVRETPLSGGQVGPTFACLLGEGFQDLKFGDRFFFEFDHRSPLPYVAFTEDQVKTIKQYSMAKILCKNNFVKTIQKNVFRPHNMYSNHMYECSDLDDLDLQHWTDHMTTSGESSNHDAVSLLKTIVVTFGILLIS